MNQVINILILTKADVNRLFGAKDSNIKKCIEIVQSAIEVIYLSDNKRKNQEKELLLLIKNDITNDETFEYGRENLVNLIVELIQEAEIKRISKR